MKKKLTFNLNTLSMQQFTYANKTKNFKKLSDNIPRILNIQSESGSRKNLYCINIDISHAQNLSIFPDGYFVVVRASFTLKHFAFNKIKPILKEWKRILHKNGELYIAILNEKHKNINVKLDRQILNNQTLLAYKFFSFHLKKIGFKSIKTIKSDGDFATICGVKEDHLIIIKAKHPKIPHFFKNSLSSQKLKQIIKNFNKISKNKKLLPLSVIIPVCNEEKIIKNFLLKLRDADFNLPKSIIREYIIVCNGITDNSDKIIQSFINENSDQFNIRMIYSKKGILTALHKGIESRKLNGFITKLDGDCLPSPFVLILMYINLINNKKIKATNADSLPFGEENRFTLLHHNQTLRSRRLYVHSRCCTYRTNPFNLFDFNEIKKSKLVVDDMIFSYCYALYYGLDSMQQTPYAIVYPKPVENKTEFNKKYSRLRKEIINIERVFPYFIPLKSVLDRHVFIENSILLSHKSTSIMLSIFKWTKNYNIKTTKTTSNKEWDRLGSTKNFDYASLKTELDRIFLNKKQVYFSTLIRSTLMQN